MQYRSPFSSEHKIIPAAEACCCKEKGPTECCPGLWPSDLLLTITSAPAGCDCVGKSVVIEATETENVWDYAFMPMDGNCGPFSISFNCDPETGKYMVDAIDAWTLEKHADSCDPFSITGVPGWLFSHACNGMEIEVTTNPLP